METSAVYRKPGVAKYIIYFLLLLLSLAVLINFWMGRNWLKIYAHFYAGEKLGFAQAKAIAVVFQTLDERLGAPGLWMLAQEAGIDKNKAKAILEEYPETPEMGILKKGREYLSIASRTGSEELKGILTKSAAAFYDTAEVKKSNISVFDYKTGEGIMVIRHYFNAQGKDYGLYFFNKGEDVYITVTDYDVIQGLLPLIMQGMKQYHREEFNRYFGQYPEGVSVVVTFSHKNKQDFFTLGKPKGKEWKTENGDKNYQDMPIFPGGWYVRFQVFADNLTVALAGEEWGAKMGVPWYFAAEWYKVVELIIGALAILLLGHFSPWMHGFRKSRN